MEKKNFSSRRETISVDKPKQRDGWRERETKAQQRQRTEKKYISEHRLLIISANESSIISFNHGEAPSIEFEYQKHTFFTIDCCLS